MFKFFNDIGLAMVALMVDPQMVEIKDDYGRSGLLLSNSIGVGNLPLANTPSDG